MGVQTMKIRLLIFLLIMSSLLAACSKGGNDKPAAAVQAYLTALVEKDASGISTLSCAAWEESARTELDSLMAVETRLENVACVTDSVDNDVTLVKCQGSIVYTYDNESPSLELNTRNFQVVKESGDWRVCGYR
jgi:hypothetical protein